MKNYPIRASLGLKPAMALLLALGLALALGGCGSGARIDPAKAHHTAEGFRNNYPHPDKPSFWKWQWQRWTGDVPANPEGGYGFPVLQPDIAFLATNRSAPTFTWIGHATFLLQLGGVNILTDPHFTERASPVSFAGPKRHTPLPLPLSALPRIDLVIISHNHYDHLDLDTVRQLNAQAGGAPLFMVPLGLKQWFADQGISNVDELDWWDRRTPLGLTVHLAPVQHWSKRTLWDTNRSLWGSWIIEAGGKRVFFGGDFGYSRDLADIGQRLGPFDLAMLPVGAYEPRWFMQIMHVDPDEAVQAHRDLRARRSVGMHWGTFRLTDERLDDPPQRLAQARARAGLDESEFFVLKHGETRPLD